MKLSKQPYKGARDFYPEDKRLQSYLFSVMREVCKRYGYEEYDAPILEPTELYLQKGNHEIIQQQTYTFNDRGDRSVTLRTEMTPSAARMVAGRRQELAYPARWFSIPQCWRYERMQRGRGREFYQLNVDIFGEHSTFAEHELILVISDLLNALGAHKDMFTIKVNSRAFMDWVLGEKLNISADTKVELFRIIDRMHKIDEATFLAQLGELLPENQNAISLIDALLRSRKIDDIPQEYREHSSLFQLRELMQLCENSGVTNIIFDPSVTRGFEYYTGTVFEVFDNHTDNKRSMFGGGRYDNLLDSFGVDQIPAAGFGMGDMPLLNFLEVHDLVPNLSNDIELYAICIGGTYTIAQPLLAELRQKGINVAVDARDKKVDKGIKAAEKKGIKYVAFIGEDEITGHTVTLRELSTGNEEKLAPDAVAKRLLQPH